MLWLRVFLVTPIIIRVQSHGRHKVIFFHLWFNKVHRTRNGYFVCSICVFNDLIKCSLNEQMSPIFDILETESVLDLLQTYMA